MFAALWSSMASSDFTAKTLTFFANVWTWG
jgi:hypothetical protein